MRIPGPQTGQITAPMALQTGTAEPAAPSPAAAAVPAAPAARRVDVEPRVIDLVGARVELQPNDLAKVVDKMNETYRIFNHTMRFQVEDGDIRVKLIDTNTGEIVREIPPEKLLDTFRRVQNFIGVMMDERV